MAPTAPSSAGFLAFSASATPAAPPPEPLAAVPPSGEEKMLVTMCKERRFFSAQQERLLTQMESSGQPAFAERAAEIRKSTTERWMQKCGELSAQGKL